MGSDIANTDIANDLGSRELGSRDVASCELAFPAAPSALGPPSAAALPLAIGSVLTDQFTIWRLVARGGRRESLAARIARGPLPPRTAARIARQLLQGLGAAHAADVLHLDFKSQNVMLRAGMLRTEAVIMDFSLSRVLEAGVRRGARERHALGSPGYMSPERLEGRTALGPASDLYSFGVVLFEMLTGRLPFPNEPAKALMALRLAQPTPLPSHALPGLTTAFDAFVAKCLARHPAYRFPDAESALAALDGCLSRPRGRPNRWWRRLGRARRSG